MTYLASDVCSDDLSLPVLYLPHRTPLFVIWTDGRNDNVRSAEWTRRPSSRCEACWEPSLRARRITAFSSWLFRRLFRYSATSRQWGHLNLSNLKMSLLEKNCVGFNWIDDQSLCKFHNFVQADLIDAQCWGKCLCFKRKWIKYLLDNCYHAISVAVK